MKRRIKRLITCIAIGAICFCGAAYANDDIKVELNGHLIEFDAKPFISNERTLVPIRAITEAMDCDVAWNSIGKYAIISNNEISVNITINKSIVEVTDLSTGSTDYVYADAPAEIYQDRTYVPLRVISEAFGADVNWNGELRKVTITYLSAAKNELEDEVVSFADKAFEYSVQKRLKSDYDYDGELTKSMLSKINDVLFIHDAPDGTKSTSIADYVKLPNLQRLTINKEGNGNTINDLMSICGQDSVFADPAFELCVRANIAYNYDDRMGDIYLVFYVGDITEDMLQNVSTISSGLLPDSIKLSSIEDLELVPNVENIYIDNNQNIEDFSPIATIKTWKNISLEGLDIEDDSFLDKINVTESIDFPNLGEIESAYDFTSSESKYQYKEALPTYRKAVKKFNEFKKTINNSMSDYEKFKAIHDYVVLNMAYDWDLYEARTYGYDYDYDMNYGLYPDTLSSFFVGGKGVCEYYAETYSKLCSYYGLECWVVSGIAGDDDDWDDHAWNIVNLDGNYYHVDVTWDDPDEGKDIEYGYFLVSDKTIEADHEWEGYNEFLYKCGFTYEQSEEILRDVPQCPKDYR